MSVIFQKIVSKGLPALVLFFISRGAVGADAPPIEIIFGPEFTFTNGHLSSSFAFGGVPHSAAVSFYLDQWVKTLRSRVNTAEAIARNGGRVQVRKRWRHFEGARLPMYRVTYPDGWHYNVFADPGVLEVTAHPESLERFKHLERRMQRDIFDVAEAVKLWPSRVNGGGHIHIGKFFEGRPLLLRNFIVDFYNHAGLSMGGLGHNMYAAAHFLELSAEQRQAFVEAIEDIDRVRPKTSLEVAEILFERFYQRQEINGREIVDPYWKNGQQGWDQRPSKYHALTLHRMIEYLLHPDQHTIELRALHAQANAAAFISLIELFQKRILYLSSFKKPVHLKRRRKRPGPQEVIRDLRRYVEDVGESFQRFTPFLPEGWDRPGGLCQWSLAL